MIEKIEITVDFDVRLQAFHVRGKGTNYRFSKLINKDELTTSFLPTSLLIKAKICNHVTALVLDAMGEPFEINPRPFRLHQKVEDDE